MLFLQEDAPPGIGDNEVLDQFTIPFGTWTEQAVNWVTLNLEWLLEGIEWPFEFLLSNIVDNFLIELPWLVLVGMMFLIAWLVRNLTVAAGTAGALVVCGLLGDEYWVQTARTIGFIVVAVVICVVIGIPLGILAGRLDSVWSVLRPTLDAMQVIHSFVYLLPFVYFWGVGRVSATMATMVFALPPLIRLTNLGIRQVPEDVVEASRAYGATELRVLRDVQLPLARPAIMTGINQTLLLAFSMLGIAAILGAGGLGQLLFRALGQQDVALAASSGLAFFLLAVILDRIAQPQSGANTSLFTRIVGAWKARRAPEILLDDPDFNPDVEPVAVEPELADAIAQSGEIAAVGPAERRSIYGVIAGAVVMMISVLLPWGTDAGLVTGYSRRSDQSLPGESFNGLAPEGGSWFGIILIVLSLVAILASANMLMRPGAGGRWLAPDGALLASIGGLLTVLGYVLIQPSVLTLEYSHGFGVYVGIAGGLVATVFGVLWVRDAEHGPRRPLKPHVVIGPIAVAVAGVLFAVVSMFSSWTLDERQDAVITPAIQAELDEVIRQSEAGEIEPGVAATRIQTIRATAVADDAIVLDGKTPDGPGLGIVVLVLSLIGGAGGLGAAGVFGLGERRQWIGGIVAMGFGVGIMAIASGWIGSLARATDPNFTSGVGVLFALITGVHAIVSGRLIVGGYERSKVYPPLPALDGEQADRGLSDGAVAVAAGDALSSTAGA
ncbi:MAG: ABC transporter permease subunit [Acidimicrobiales bacterium]|nr:ABC transporter permease subunit [Acidimicrobiales bacterium]